MLNIQVLLNLPEGIYQNVSVTRCIYQNDYLNFPNLSPTRDSLVTIYESWKNLNKTLTLVGARGVNIPEGLTEVLYCYLSGAWRTNKLNIQGCNTSFDCYLPANQPNLDGQRIQIKACSVAPDLTSFGPHSVWDKLIFIDFSEGNGNFYIYDIPTNLVTERILNSRNGETFTMQQLQGRRPRLSLLQVIQENNLQYSFTGNIYQLPIY